MAVEKKDQWRRFRKLRFDAKSLSKRARRAETLTTKHAHKFVMQRLSSIRNARRRIINWLTIVTAIVVAIGLQQVWYRDSYTTTTAAVDGTYAEGVLGPVETLNPLYARSSAEQSATRLIFSSLLDYDETGNLRGDLAESVTIDDTGKSYTVKLRPDALWHDGQRLTSEDVVFTVNAMKSQAARATMASSWQNIVATADSIEVVRFTLPNQYASFRHALTFSVLPKHILESVDLGTLRENQFSTAPIGSGPFVMKLLQSAGTVNGEKKVVHLARWSKYYKGTPKLARFQLHAYTESKEIIDALATREVNAALDINDFYDQIPSGIETSPVAINSGVYAEFNTSSTVLSDKAVRRALQVGTDPAAVRSKIGMRAPALDTPILRSQLSNVTLPSKPVYNIITAKKQLDEAGWRVGGDGTRSKDGVELAVRVVSIKDRQYKLIAEELARQWKELGIEVTYAEFDPRTNPQGFLQTILQPRAYDVLINELSIGADPDVFAYWHSSQANASGLNFSNYDSDISDDILLSARQREDQALRSQKYKAFAEQWMKDAPAIGLYQSVRLYAKTSSVTSIDTSATMPSAVDRYSNILYWSADKTQVYKTP